MTTLPADLFDDSGPSVADPRPGDPVAQVVVVCHANIARSPLGMAMVAHHAQARLGESADVWVRSAGVHARPGLAAAEESRHQASLRGLDLSHHRAAVLTRDDVATTDLVLTMSEKQRAHAVRLHPPAAGWTFTLPELARLCASLDPLDPSLPPRERIRQVARLASSARPYVPRSVDPEDVADPYRGTAEDYARMAELVEAQVEVIADVLFGESPTG